MQFDLILALYGKATKRISKNFYLLEILVDKF